MSCRKRMNVKSVIIYTISTHENQLPQVRYFARGLKQAGFDVTVAGPLGPSCCEELRGLGVRVLVKRAPVLQWLRGYRLARLLEVAMDSHTRSDLAIGLDSSGLMLAYLAYRLGRAKYLGAYFLEYDPPDCFRWQIRSYHHLIAPRLARKLTLLVDVDPVRLEERRSWMRVPGLSGSLRNSPPRSFVSPDRAACNSGPEAPLRFLYQGMLGPLNGVDCLLAGFALADPAKCTLTLAGHSPDPDHLVQSIRATCPAGNVTYAGLVSRNELAEFISAHDVGIVLYPWRDARDNPGLALCAPNKLYEYFARGLPVICSDNRGLRFVPDQRLGWQIDPRDPRQLAELVATLCTARTTVREYGERALTKSQSEWHFEHDFQNVVELIRSIGEREA